MAKVIPRYFMQNKMARWGLTVIDTILSFFLRKSQSEIPIPKKILLVNLGHIGDIVILTSLLKPLKENYPEIKMGVVVGSHSKMVVEGHPNVDWVHIVDHFKVNRNPKKRLLTYLKTRKQALKEIKKIGYDISVDCTLHFPNLAPFFWQANIQTRLGYTTAGFSSFLTHALPWSNINQSVAYFYLELLKQIPQFSFEKPLKPSLHIEKETFFGDDYIVLHMGAGDAIKEYPLSKWAKLLNTLKDEKIVFTGKGAKENQSITSILQSCHTNLCDKLSWEELVSLIKNAKKIYTVDTSVAHIAAAFDTPTIVLSTGIYPSRLWAPLSEKATCLTYATSCSPCFNGRGCKSMSCIKSIELSMH